MIKLKVKIFVIILSLISFTLRSQNLVKNPSFEKKNKVEKFEYGYAERTLLNWEYLKFHATSLSHPSDAVYVDTLLFKSFIEEGFPFTAEINKTVVKPYHGTCYIKSNNYHKSLFRSELKKPLTPDLPYIIIFKYQIKSLSNELSKFNTAKFGFSLSKTNTPIKELRDFKYKLRIDPKYRNYIIINKLNPSVEKDWQSFSAVFSPEAAYKFLHIGTHMDFKTNTELEKGFSYGKRSRHQGSFIFFIDYIELYTLHDFFTQNLAAYKGVNFALPRIFIDNSFRETDFDNNEYFKKLKSFIKNRLDVDVQIVDRGDLSNETKQKIILYFKKLNQKEQNISFVLDTDLNIKLMRSLDPESNVFITIK